MRASRPRRTARPAVLTRSIVCMAMPSKRHSPPPVSPMPEPLMSNTKSDSPEQASRTGVTAVARGTSRRSGSLPGFAFDFPKRRKLNTRRVYLEFRAKRFTPGYPMTNLLADFKILPLSGGVRGGVNSSSPDRVG
jgi:hypothetical protein